ncbi:hypothetical protein [Aliikangiella sp. G2MR2-5]|uniref:hypothetical protein n=1 Tax=Aliikangiella sp. G2MR2-5 TaxID=2788943 RepID=UPI0018A9F777|nr:hypothetical protein [Aliikangiella sp. G2MR2-5]
MSLVSSKVYLKGFDSRSEQAFEKLFKEHMESEFELTKYEQEAQILIVDLDVCIGQFDIQTLRDENPLRGIVGLSLLENSSHDSLVQYLAKPVDLKLMEQQLLRMKKILLRLQIEQERKKIVAERQIENRTINENSHLRVAVNNSSRRNTRDSINKSAPARQPSQSVIGQNVAKAPAIDAAKYVGKNSDVNLSNPQAIIRVLYSPQNLFQGAVEKAIKRAKKHQKPVELICLNTGVIIDLKENAAFTAVGDSVLKPLCLMKVEKIDSLRKIKPDYTGIRLFELAHKPQGKLKRWDLQAFMWKISLWSSRGKLPREIDLERAFYLTEWPNFSKLVCFPYAMNIASLMMKRPMKLAEISRTLNIPQRFVFGFFSAAQSLGIIESSSQKLPDINDWTKAKSLERNYAEQLLSYLIYSEDSIHQKLA